MNFHIRDFIQEVKAWFPHNQAPIEVKPGEREAQSPEQNHTPLSSEQINNYQIKINSLSLPEAYQNAIQTKLLESLKNWKKEPNSANSLFILCHPIESTYLILKETLERVNDEELHLNFLSWKARPDDYSTFKSQLKSQIESLLNKNDTNSKSLVIIPDLSLCFLRCVEGLDAIEYLYDLILKDRSRFWVVGCNQWAWNYFDYVYQVNTCFEQILPLPTLNAIQLKQWLTPIYETLNAEFDDHQNDSEHQVNEWKDEEKNWISKDEEKYFERLAKISEGLSQIAAHLWLYSLKSVKQLEKSDSETVELQEDQPEKNFLIKRSSLPNLPELTKEDQYLLFSIGLHEPISVSALSISLGEPEIRITIQVQRLLKAGIIRRNKELLQLSPVYYSRLKKELIDHHIMTGEKN